MKFTKGQEFMAEFLGTLVLIMFGCGVCAMVALFGSTPSVPGEVVKGGYTNITLGWGLAVTFGIYIAGTISGAHLNPAVSLAMAVTGRMPWSKVFHYVVAQLLGAFAGAALVYLDFYAKFQQVDPGLTENTRWVFCTFPAVAGFWPGFIDQVIGTALLLGLILAVVDKLNALPGSNLAPIVIGLIVVVIGISFGGMNGYAINPARDFGPRLFETLIGYKANGLTDGSGAWLPPILGPLVGGVLGAVSYDFFIGRALVKAHRIATEQRPEGMDASYKEAA
jgi:glycerol uptake facilitator protein